MTPKPVIPQPYGLEFQPWAALVVEALARYGVSQPVDESAWREWACSLLYVPDLATIPTPDGFPTWLAWANRVTETTL